MIRRGPSLACPRLHQNSMLSLCCLQALQETFLVFRLAVLLYSYLGLGTRWTGKLLRLILYSVLLLPGFIQVLPAGLLESEGPPLAPSAAACSVAGQTWRLRLPKLQNTGARWQQTGSECTAN